MRADLSIEEIVGRFKDRGMRMTPQRMEVLRLLAEMSHPTAEQIFEKVHARFPFVSQATIYNTLRALKEIGVVSELAGGGQRVLHYEMASGERCHFTCRRCGQIRDVEADEPPIAKDLPKLHGSYRIEDYRLELFGICPECAEGTRGPA